MNLTNKEKEQIKQDLIEKLKDYPSLQRIIIFGSFLTSNSPNDIDVAVLDSSGKDYISLAVDYGMRLSSMKKIDIDLIPVVQSRFESDDSFFTREIKKGQVIYEK